MLEANLNAITSFFLLGFLLLGTMAAGTLVSAVRNAEDGYEDDNGFHGGTEAHSVGLA